MKPAQSFSLRKKVVKKQVVEQQGAEVLGKKGEGPIIKTGGMPIRPGEVVMLDSERKTLQEFGWQEGDAIPADFPEKLAEARRGQAESYAQKVKEVETTGKVLKPEEPVPIGSLPIGKQRALRDYMAKASVDLANFEALARERAEIAGLDPSLQKAALMASQPVEVVRRTEKPVTKTVASKPFQRVEEVQPVVAPEPQAQKSADDVPFSTGEKEMLDNARCQHCNWLLSKKDDIQPTQEDILGFATSIFSGQLFQKEMVFFGGHVRVVYRSLPATLAEMTLTQISIDRRSGKASTMDDVWRLLWDYRLICSIQQVTFGAETINVGDEVDSCLVDKNNVECEPGDTILPGMIKSLLELPVFDNESVWRLLGQNVKRFANLVEALEAKADDPSFWKAIGV